MPTCSCGSTCRPKIASGTGGVLNSPSSSMRSAPVRPPSGSPSSAGWNSITTVPGISLAQPAEDFGDGERDRDVAIVAARVLHVLDRRLVRHVDQLGDRQRIHVGAHRDDLAGLAALQHAEHAGDADAGAHLVELQRAQLVGDQLGRALLAKSELGVTVQIAADLDQRGRQLGDGLVDRGADGLRHRERLRGARRRRRGQRGDAPRGSQGRKRDGGESFIASHLIRSRRID